MFSSMLARIGIGSAEIDTVIESIEAVPGGTLSGTVKIKGGSTAQTVENIYLYIDTVAEVEAEEGEYRKTVTVGSTQIGSSFEIQPNEELDIPFSINLPWNIPINVLFGREQDNVPLLLRSGLDISAAIDPKDTDPLWISPNPIQDKILQACLDLGMRFKSTDVEYGHVTGSQSSFYQEIEFKPGKAFKGIKEVEITFVDDEHGMRVVVESDRKRKGMAAFFGGGSYDDIQSLYYSHNESLNRDFKQDLLDLLLG